MKLSKELELITVGQSPKKINSYKTAKGGFDRRALELLGVPYPPPKGWRKHLIRLYKQQNPSPNKTLVKSAIQHDVVIYTDGGCNPNPGLGGWGFVVYKNNYEVFVQSGGEADTTNNRMEIMAVLQAMRWSKENQVKALIHSDSKYVVQACTEWVAKWKNNEWRRPKGR